MILIILGLGWSVNQKYRIDQEESLPVKSEATEKDVNTSKPIAVSNSIEFKCDTRTNCSQMTSCEEAMFFRNNCPDNKMDRDNDGIPCENQWCRNKPENIK